MCLVAAFSCGNDDGTGSGTSQQEETQQEESDVGRFTITLSPLNAGIGGIAASGTGQITVDEEKMAVQIDMTGVAAKMTHLQNIMSLGSCPSTGSDVNGDGFVDVVEGIPSYGIILVPLDGNLNSQNSGFGSGASANDSGTYTYRKQAWYSSLLEDLQREDSNTEDAIGKLPEGERLNLEGRAILIHGVADSVNLPETVASLPGSTLSPKKVIPIACGVIKRAADEGTTGQASATKDM
jgi:hypothetical protein